MTNTISDHNSATILITGAVQLGSMYLQKSDNHLNNLNIFVIYIFKPSLQIAKQRWEKLVKTVSPDTFSGMTLPEIQNKVTFISSFEKITKKINIAIIGTNDLRLEKSAKHLTNSTKIPYRWDYVHNEVEYNYRIPKLNAALSCAQLGIRSEYLDSKRHFFKLFQKAFRKILNISLFEEPIEKQSNYWLQTLLLNKIFAKQRDAILKDTKWDGLITRPTWTLLNNLTPFQDWHQATLPIAEFLEKRIVNLPSSSGSV